MKIINYIKNKKRKNILFLFFINYKIEYTMIKKKEELMKKLLITIIKFNL